jgi:hypothetical protein
MVLMRLNQIMLFLEDQYANIVAFAVKVKPSPDLPVNSFGFKHLLMLDIISNETNLIRNFLIESILQRPLLL